MNRSTTTSTGTVAEMHSATTPLSRRALLGGVGALALTFGGELLAGPSSAAAATSPRTYSLKRPTAMRVRAKSSQSTLRRCVGLGARSFDTARKAQRSVISFVVIDFEWHELHTGPGKIDAAFRDVLRQQLDWCWANKGVTGQPLLVRLRPRMGMYAPTWVKNATGTLPWYTDKGTDGTGPAALSDPAWKQIAGGVPLWWSDAYGKAAHDLYAIIAREFGKHPALAEVAMGWPATQFVEPCNKQFGLDENVRAAVAAGYTDAKDDAMFRRGWDAHKALLSPLGISCYTAYNPTGAVSTTGTGSFTFGNVQRTIALMNQQVQVLGTTAVLGNNSWAPLSSQSSTYRTMYVEMQRLGAASGAPVAFQTETLTKLLRNVTVQETLLDAASFGATGAELPRGCESATGSDLIDAAWAAAVVPKFQANVR